MVCESMTIKRTYFVFCFVSHNSITHTYTHTHEHKYIHENPINNDNGKPNGSILQHIGFIFIFKLGLHHSHTLVYAYTYLYHFELGSPVRKLMPCVSTHFSVFYNRQPDIRHSKRVYENKLWFSPFDVSNSVDCVGKGKKQKVKRSYQPNP